jgi:hypothetical protein
MRWAGHVVRMRYTINSYKIGIGKHQGKGRDCLGELRVDGMIILKFTVEIRCDTVNWILLAQDRIQWRADLNIVLNLRVT